MKIQKNIQVSLDFLSENKFKIMGLILVFMVLIWANKKLNGTKPKKRKFNKDNFDNDSLQARMIELESAVDGIVNVADAWLSCEYDGRSGESYLAVLMGANDDELKYACNYFDENYSQTMFSGNRTLADVIEGEYCFYNSTESTVVPRLREICY